MTLWDSVQKISFLLISSRFPTHLWLTWQSTHEQTTRLAFIDFCSVRQVFTWSMVQIFASDLAVTSTDPPPGARGCFNRLYKLTPAYSSGLLKMLVVSTLEFYVLGLMNKMNNAWGRSCMPDQTVGSAREDRLILVVNAHGNALILKFPGSSLASIKLRRNPRILMKRWNKLCSKVLRLNVWE